ncbi:helix-turn-helix domain-containing protein [Candidimonas sp. SYP-B2681]|uniref:helix-turn-helix domain-containing protein n=1 Tax=Candidimonas sp. SYP-B2681 TaxID=2497686 RepID=UPI0013150A3A|nr:helix-turn-helix transcriptional regulator [Candidimonas sp. SYP-B2681]
MNSFAERLRQTRILRGLTQKALGAACGLSQSAIANYELGTRKAAKDIFALAHALDVNPIWLANGTGPQESMAAPVPAPSTNVLTEGGRPRTMIPWPFPNIPPEDFLSLSDASLQLIENAVRSLMASLRSR